MGPIILAGATGGLGQEIARHLLERGAVVKALVRKGSSAEKTEVLQRLGAEVIAVDFTSIADLTKACTGASCIVSALSGLREVIVDMQLRLLRAAVKVGVPRFIPSDYSIDFNRLPKGTNRNLDLRREFSRHLYEAPIQSTSILNGMFTDLLTGQAPLILFGFKKVIFWGNADQLLDFTTMKDTAAFTAAAALDPTTPRFLRIAGEVSNIKGLRKSAQEATGSEFGLIRIGSLGFLSIMIKITKMLFPQKKEVFPAWQGMQYLHNMLTGLPKLAPLDNNRYPEIQWTSVKEVLVRGKG